MSTGDFFSGLVQGLGGSIAQMHQQKTERDYQDRMTRLNILMSASRDPNMQNSVRREVLRQGLSEFGPKYAGLADTIVQDHDVDTGRQVAGGTQEYDVPDISPQPIRPPGLDMPVDSRQPMVSSSGNAPRIKGRTGRTGSPPERTNIPGNVVAGGQMQVGSGAMAAYGQGMDGSAQLGAGPFSGNLGTGGESAAPVTQSMTGGMSANPTPAEVQVEHMRKILRIMPSRPETLRSDSMSPAQEDQYRQMDMTRQQTSIQQQAAQSGKMWELQNITIPTMKLENELRDESLTREIKAHLAAIPAQEQAQILGQINGQIAAAKAAGVTLTPDNLKQMMGINPYADPAATDSARRAQLFRDKNSSDPAVRQGAELQIRQEWAQLQGTQANALRDVVGAQQVLQGGSPAQQSRDAANMAVEAKRRASAVFKNVDLIRNRAKAIQAQLDVDDPVGKPMGTHIKTALEQASKEVETMRQNVEAQIGLALTAGKQPVLYSEALKEYQSHPNPQGLTFQQVLDKLEASADVVLIDDGTDPNQALAKSHARFSTSIPRPKGKPKFVPGQVVPSH
jgi:hypothetical protein